MEVEDQKPEEEPLFHHNTVGTNKKRKWLIFIFALNGVIILIVGLVIGYSVGRSNNKEDDDKFDVYDLKAVTEYFMKKIQPENIKENLRNLTAQPHIAGSPLDLIQAQQLQAFWQEVGLSPVHVVGYDVLLSYPDPENPNIIRLYDEAGNIVHQSLEKEKELRLEENFDDVVAPYGAYSASGSPRGPLVFVNYGRVEDFIWITEKKGISINGSICIVKYGKVNRGDKVAFATQYGCLGLLIYSDPQDYAKEGTEPENVYPNTWWLPGTGVQRGSMVLISDEVGDILTPGYPSTADAYRISGEGTKLPTIPVQPICYDDAHVFLRHMGGEEAPIDWQGALPITYRLGPGFNNSEWEIQMNISTHNQRGDIYNVIGFIKGSEEPDRYVVIGNHRDAWAFGGLDPNIGTAVMMEMSRVMGHMLAQGWKPRRTLVFGSWSGEEFDIIGSREWVEHFAHILGPRTVAHLNTDTVVKGNFAIDVEAMPLMTDLLWEAAKKVPNPDPVEVADGRPTVYDTWLYKSPEKDPYGIPTGEAKIELLGAGSDHSPFFNNLGITTGRMEYGADPQLSSTPLYHSAYESFYEYTTFVDPTFSFAKAMCQYWGTVTLTLSESPILPFNVTRYPAELGKYAIDLNLRYGDTIRSHGLTLQLEKFYGSIKKFHHAAQNFQSGLENMVDPNALELRQINDQMMHLERNFIDPLGLPGRPLVRHVIYAASSSDSYAGSTFPGLVDALFRIDTVTQEPEITQRWQEVARQLSILTYFIQSAADLLKDPVDFVRDAAYV